MGTVKINIISALIMFLIKSQKWKKKSDFTALSKNLILPVLINRNGIFTLLQLLFGRFIKIHSNILGRKKKTL